MFRSPSARRTVLRVRVLDMVQSVSDGTIIY
jgi:hypothetical protein